MNRKEKLFFENLVHDMSYDLKSFKENFLTLDALIDRVERRRDEIDFLTKNGVEYFEAVKGRIQERRR